jgi:signal transduction histidine kinase
MAEGGQLSVIGDQSSVDGEEWLRIAVKDTGAGILPENMKRLFEPLFTTKVKGIGLGLAVSKKLAEANGGRIEVQSETGVGSTFILWLPIQQEKTS